MRHAIGAFPLCGDEDGSRALEVAMQVFRFGFFVLQIADGRTAVTKRGIENSWGSTARKNTWW
jgi:hypothetical protein